MEQFCSSGGGCVSDPNIKRISYFQFIWTIFLLTSAGPFGFEYTVIGVGVGYTLLLITLFALFYAFPIALVSSELACLMPSRHGQIIWAYRAFNKINPKLGDFVGFLNAANVVIFWCLNTTVIPIVIVQYLETLTSGDPLSNVAIYFIKLAFILSGLILNIFNFSIITRITSILCVAIILPFFIAFFWTLPDINPTTQWVDCGTNWPLAITTCLWEFAGFESLGSIVNEINFHPRRLYSGYIIGIIADIAMLYLPILSVATLTSDECNAWFDGYFAVGYANLAITLQYSVAIGSILINWCIYVSAVGIVSRMLWATAQPYFEIHNDGSLVIQEGYDSDEDNNNNTPNHRENRGNITRIAINILPNKYIGEIFEPTGSPIYAVIVVSLFIALTNIYLGFGSLVEFNLFTYFVFFVIECASYLILKHVEPETERLFEIPFGKIGGWICIITLTIGLGICFFIMVIDDASLFSIALGMNLLLILYYFISKYFCHRMHQNDIFIGSKNKHQIYSQDGNNDIDNNNINNDDDGYQEIQPLI